MLRTNKLSKSLISVFILLSVVVAFNCTLAEVRPGDVITKDNLEKVKDLLPDYLLNEIRNGYEIKIIETPRICYSKEFQETTRKYSSQVELTIDGGLMNYIGGVPFPKIDPKAPDAGLKIGWNSYRAWLGDDHSYGGYTGQRIFSAKKNSLSFKNVCRRWCIDKARNETVSDLLEWSLYPSARVRVPPIPAFKGFEHIEKFRIYRTLSPRDISGTASLEIRYWDPLKQDDMWLYIPSIRRVRRFPTSARAATRAPGDYCWDDGGGFCGKVPLFEWELIGETKRLLMVSHWIPQKHKAGYYLPLDETWAIVDCWKLTHKCKDPNYAIPKRIMYVEKNTFIMFEWNVYDKKGELWRCHEVPLGFYSTPEGENTWAVTGMWVKDVQSGHTTGIDARQISFDNGFTPEPFAIANILRLSRGDLSFR